MKSIESRVERLEASFGNDVEPLVLAVSFGREVGADGRDTHPDGLAGLALGAGGYVPRMPGESRNALVERAAAYGQVHRHPHSSILLIERYGHVT